MSGETPEEQWIELRGTVTGPGIIPTTSVRHIRMVTVPETELRFRWDIVFLCSMMGFLAGAILACVIFLMQIHP